MGNNNVKPLPNKKLTSFNSKDPIDLYAFTWNTEAIQSTENYQGIKFMIPFMEKIKRRLPKIVVVCLQEDTQNSSFMPSIKKLMKAIDYIVPRETKTDRNADHELMGLGKASYRNSVIPKKRGLRMTVFVNDKWWGELKKKYTHVSIEKESGTFGNWFKKNIYRGKGYTIVRLILPHPIGSIAFANMHNVYNSDAFKKLSKEERERIVKELPNSNADKRLIYKHSYFKHRSESLKDQITCLKELVGKLKKDDVRMIIGDLNFRIIRVNPFPLDGNADLDSYYYQHPNHILNKIDNYIKKREFDKLHRFIKNHDELWLARGKESWLKDYCEGVLNRGPQFLPTCKMLKGRDQGKCSIKDYSVLDNLNIKESERVKRGKKRLETADECYKFGVYNHRVPSYCDRILYSSGPSIKIDCRTYGSYDNGPIMSRSDHSAVYGTYQIQES